MPGRIVVVAAIFVLVMISGLLLSTRDTSADFVGGSGGSGGGCGSWSYPWDFCTTNGYGWQSYRINGRDGVPFDFDDDTRWSSVVRACRSVGADTAWTFIVKNSRGDARVYSMSAGYGGYNQYPTVKSRYNEAASSGDRVRGTPNWGGSLAWFCYNSNPINFNLTPTLSTEPSSSVSGTGTAKVTSKINNSGSTASTSAQWRLSRFTVAPGSNIPGRGDNSRTPTQHYGNGATTSSSKSQVFNRNQTTLPEFSESIGNYPDGTRLCYALSINPISQSNSNWRHSTPDCIIVTKDYKLTPTVSVGPESTESGSGAATIAPTVTNGGLTESVPAQWEVSKFVIKPGVSRPVGDDNGRTPLQYYGNDADTTEFETFKSGEQAFDKGATVLKPALSDPVSDYAVGTQICYALSVQPLSHSSSNWRHGEPDCVIISKKPKLQIHGGDLRVGARFVDQVAVVDGSFIKTSQTVKTTGSPSVERTFGSWVEYGVIASGLVTGLGSGSAFAGPGLPNTTQCSYTFLTFTNGGSTNCKASPTLGGYNSGTTLPSVASRFPVAEDALISGEYSIASLDDDTYYRTDGESLEITGGELPAGKTIIINTSSSTGSYGKVTISGDITYTTSTLSGVGEIPQLVIIAGDIDINESVQQVDSWLISKGTLNTCADISMEDINSKKCQDRLTINGPVMASQVSFWRTGGSIADNTGALGDPAEVFNLRPDAYLWGIAQSAKSGRLETTYERELPPRY